MLALSHVCLSIHPSIHSPILFLMWLKVNYRHQSFLPVNISACKPLIGVQHCFQLFLFWDNLKYNKCTNFKCTSQWVLTKTYICATQAPIKIQNITITQKIPSQSIPTPFHRHPLFLFFSTIDYFACPWKVFLMYSSGFHRNLLKRNFHVWSLEICVFNKLIWRLRATVLFQSTSLCETWYSPLFYFDLSILWSFCVHLRENFIPNSFSLNCFYSQ